MSFVIPTVAQVVLLALVFWYRFKEARHADGTRYFDAFKVAMHNINLAMLPWVLGLDIYGLVYQDSLDWLRVGCILYMAGLYACQIILTAVAVPRYIWDKPVIGLGISCLAVLAIPTWYTFAAKFRRAFDAAPHCYDQDQPTEFAEVLGIGSAIFVVQAFLLALATFLNWDKPGAGPLSPSTELQRLAWWPLWRVALFLVVPLGLLVLITVFLLNDINAVRPWMNPAESHMGLSEFLIVLVAAGAVATTLCNAADLDSKSTETPPPHSLIDAR